MDIELGLPVYLSVIVFSSVEKRIFSAPSMVLFDRATPGSLGWVMILWEKKRRKKKNSQEFLEVVVKLLRDSHLIK